MARPRGGPVRRGRARADHMVSAFAARQRLVLGQVKVAEKSNEIVAIPKLLDMLAIEGAIVTIDAMGCQREIAQKVVEKKADYVLALKGDRGRCGRMWNSSLPSRKRPVSGHHDQSRPDGGWRSRPDQDQDHDRHSRRRLATGTSQLARPECLRGGRERAGNRQQDRAGDPLLPDVPGADGVHAGADRTEPLGDENSLHWILDMVFRDDECRL